MKTVMRHAGDSLGVYARVAEPGVHRLGRGEVVRALEQLGNGQLLPGRLA